MLRVGCARALRTYPSNVEVVGGDETYGFDLRAIIPIYNNSALAVYFRRDRDIPFMPSKAKDVVRPLKMDMPV